MADMHSATAEITRGKEKKKEERTRMWAYAQRDGHWPPCRIQVAPSVQRRKVSLTRSTGVPCSNAAKTRNPLKLAGVPQTTALISASGGP